MGFLMTRIDNQSKINGDEKTPSGIHPEYAFVLVFIRRF
jgi:hypothetical protein